MRGVSSNNTHTHTHRNYYKRAAVCLFSLPVCVPAPRGITVMLCLDLQGHCGAGQLSAAMSTLRVSHSTAMTTTTIVFDKFAVDTLSQGPRHLFQIKLPAHSTYTEHTHQSNYTATHTRGGHEGVQLNDCHQNFGTPPEILKSITYGTSASVTVHLQWGPSRANI